MLSTHEKFRMIDEAKNNDFFAEVNWDTSEVNNDCKIVRFTFPDGKEAFVKREYLNEMLFAIGKPEDQQQMIPQTIERVHEREVKLSIRASKDIRKGEQINLKPIHITVPCATLNMIGALKKDEVKSEFAI